MRKKYLGAALVAAVLSISGFAACGDDDDDNGGGAAAPAATTTTGGGAAGGEGGGQIDPNKPEVRLALMSIKIPGINLLDYFETGAKAAEEYINDNGGFGGRKLVIDVCNSMAQPSTAMTCARKGLAKKPIAQFGCEIAWSQGGLQLYAKNKIPSFNCTNNEEDFTNPWSYGLHPGIYGYDKGRPLYACTRDDIKKAVVVTQDIPQQRQLVPAVTKPVMDDCGKELEVVYYPPGATDLTAVIQKVARANADVVFLNTTGPQVVPMVQGLVQNNIKGDKLWLAEGAFNYDEVVKPLGDALEGALYFGGWTAWDDTSTSDAAEYFSRMEAAGISKDEARAPFTTYGYAEVMFFYEAAKQIGFDKFDAATLKEFADSANGVKIPMAREYTNPGPEAAPQLKQSWAQIAKWEGGKLTPITEGTEQGWINLF
jgi:ABC-type branched-subunit amino acid transport system substrate-binding protein